MIPATPTSPSALDTSVTVRLATSAMGTRFELVLVGDDQTHLRAAGEEAIGLIEDAHARYSRFDRDSIISQLNRTPETPVDDETRALLGLCESINADSNGAFDARAAGQLDLGGVAKGFAIDLAIESLRDNAVASALLHGGTSTVAAIGSPPDADEWTVAIAHTDRTIPLRDQTLSVSSPTGQDLPHIIDPRTREPVADERLAICVGESAAETDAWSTALVVLGYRPASMPDRITSSIETPIPGSSNGS